MQPVSKTRICPFLLVCLPLASSIGGCGVNPVQDVVDEIEARLSDAMQGVLDDVLWEARDVAPNGEPVEGAITVPGEVVHFLFTAVQAKIYDIRVQSPAPVVMRLYEEDDPTIIASNDTTLPAGRIIWPAGQTQDLRIAITLDDYMAVGDFILTVSASTDDHSNDESSATPVQPDGSPVPGLINYPGDVDYFVFQAEPDRVYMVETIGASDTLLILEVFPDLALSTSDPEGEAEETATVLMPLSDPVILGSDDDGGDELNARVFWRAPNSGLVFVGVEAYTTATADYALSVNSTLDDHANEIDGATHLSVDGGPVGGISDYPTDIDYFAFSAEVGRAYKFETSGSSGVLLVLFDAEGNNILEWHDNGIEEAYPAVIWVASSTGLHYVAVAATAEAYGTYSLSVESLTDDHASSSGGASRVMADGPAEPGAIDYANDLDYFVFATEPDQMYRIETHGAFDTAMRLLGGDGDTELVWDDDSGDGANAMITWVSTNGDDYYVEVAAFNGGEGEYTLTVRIVVDDHGNSVSDATSISADGEGAAGRIDFPIDADYFRLPTDAQTPYILEVIATEEVFATLLAPDGRSNLDSVWGGPGATGRTGWLAREAGDYYIKVEGVDGADYSVSIVPSVDDHGDDTEHATSVSFNGERVAGVINYRGDVDFFSFTAETGIEYVIQTHGDLDTTMTLIGPDATSELVWDDESGEVHNARIVWTSPSAETYYVAVRPYFEDSLLDSYELAVTSSFSAE